MNNCFGKIKIIENRIDEVQNKLLKNEELRSIYLNKINDIQKDITDISKDVKSLEGMNSTLGRWNSDLQ